MSKAKQLEHLESTCATLRAVLEWYAGPDHKDGGERARLALDAVDAGCDLLRDLRQKAAMSEMLAAELTEARRRLTQMEGSETAQMAAVMAVAERYRRCVERYVGWFKEHFGVNCPHAAADRYRGMMRVWTAAEIQARTHAPPSPSLFGRLAAHAPRKLPPLRGQRNSLIHAVAYIVRGDENPPPKRTRRAAQ